MPHIPPLNALALTLLVLAPGAALACDALVGSYALAAGGVAVINIVKTPTGYALSTREGGRVDGPWKLAEPSMRAGTSAQLNAGGVGVEMDANSCGLSAPDGLFLKVKPGAKYQDNSRTGQNRIETRGNETGYMIYLAQGIVVAGVDLFPVPFTGQAARQ
ncbi:hypothetical protein ACFDR9_002247 [Janthinobacterium sp. CG_23.3]|uniref:hypothetical protein n=1 Tax=Janthinobacterium sp. CG_23.3 TaxID=3349634 RepID=UPI0038D4E98D